MKETSVCTPNGSEFRPSEDEVRAHRWYAQRQLRRTYRKALRRYRLATVVQHLKNAVLGLGHVFKPLGQ